MPNKIAVLDLETDPFEHGKMIQPFVAGFYDGERFITFWSADCVERMVHFLETQTDEYTIYAHNGGRFDFFYFLDHLAGAARIVNSRIIQARLGKHELRDSFAIMPFPLESYHKTEIDYDKFKKHARENHKEEILSYLRDDCVDLYKLCITYRQEFGDVLTIGSASMKQLKEHHHFKCGNGEYDAKFRSKFYFGGRNQVFRSGIIAGSIKVFDVNSMYPHVMQSCLHPVGTGVELSRSVQNNTAFIVVEGKNDGAFPTRQKDGSLDFTVPRGTFHTTIHEFNAAIDTGAFRPTRIIKCYGFKQRETFAEFVEHFYTERMKAKAAKDEIRTLFYKFVLNSAYGKFAQNPENYYDWAVSEIGTLPGEWHECKRSCDEPCRLKWLPAFMAQKYIIWKRPLRLQWYYNIATGASITGAARALLLRGLRAVHEPLYCDTDSIICRDASRLPISDSQLGAWKLETTGRMAAICGKKLYAVFDAQETNHQKVPCTAYWCVKKAHKGARLSAFEILRIAEGETIEACNPVPAFKFDGTFSFTKRKIRRTAA